MKHTLLSGLTIAAVTFASPAALRAHGGQYVGPQDIVPPPGGGNNGGNRPTGPQTGGPTAPSAPRPSGPATGGPAAPGTGGTTGPRGRGGTAPTGPQTGGRGAQLSSDFTRWNFWWEFNKAPFIRLRDAVHATGPQTGSDDHWLGVRKESASNSMRPTDQDILGIILPALKKAIDSTDQRDITSSCMIAMAKIGQDHPEFTLKDVFTPRLARNDQEIRETAALALGIAAIAGEDELQMLSDLALDRGVGRRASDGSVNNRTRAFALYGLGLMAHKTTKIEIKQQAFASLKAVLEDQKVRDRNLKVAAINGMGILNIGTQTQADNQLLTDVVATLEQFFLRRVGAGQNLIQSHCPPAIAKLIGREHPDADRFKQMFAAELDGSSKIKRSGNSVAQSCALALGQLAKAYNKPSDQDSDYSELLLKMWRGHKDVQTRNFAILSLGWIGGDHNREALLKAFDKATKTQKKPWCALALGVYSHLKYAAQTERDGASIPESFIGETLLKEFATAKNPDLQGALAIGLGLNRYLDAADAMRSRMLKNQHQEELAGYLAIGLALMGDDSSKEDIKTVVDQSTRRFTLLQQAAIALGKLGDKDAAGQLRALLTDGEPNLAKLGAIASAIGFIGDRRSIAPLKGLLFDDQLGDLSRAFAAVALGGIADKEPLPWNAKIGTNMNYRAQVETLTGNSSGILDIL